MRPWPTKYVLSDAPSSAKQDVGLCRAKTSAMQVHPSEPTVPLKKSPYVRFAPLEAAS
jgi:hypothetical protein